MNGATLDNFYFQLLLYYFILNHCKEDIAGTSLTLQWLKPQASTPGVTGLISDQGTKILHADWPQKEKRKKNVSFYQNFPKTPNVFGHFSLGCSYLLF